MAAASSGAINPTTVNAADISQYESPYQSDVINATQAEIQNQNQQQAAGLTGSAIGSGAFGGDRAGIAQAALAGQQDLASNETLANLNNQNYSQALGEANTQQSVGLGAAQNTAARQLAASQQLGTLGTTAQTEALNEANAQTNAGTLEQTTQQAQDTAAYNQFLQKQAYPFETTGWLANIVEGIGSQSGGSSTGSTTTEGSAGSAVAGGLLGLASFLARGGRVPHRASGGGLGGGIYIPQDQIFDPTASTGPQGLGGGAIVPTTGGLAVGHTMPTQGAPAAPAAPTPQQQAQTMGQMAKGVQGLGNAFNNSALGDQFNDAIQDMNDPVAAAPIATDVGGGLGGIGMMARGGIVGRRHYWGGGAPAVPSTAGRPMPPALNDTFGSYGDSSQRLMPGSAGPASAPTPVSNPKPAGAASYSVFPVQMSDGSWSTTQNLSNGIAPAASAPLQNQMFARGGLVGRRHYDDGGGIAGNPDFGTSPDAFAAWLNNGNAAPVNPAAGMPAPNVTQEIANNSRDPYEAWRAKQDEIDYADQMPAPNVARETLATPGAANPSVSYAPTTPNQMPEATGLAPAVPVPSDAAQRALSVSAGGIPSSYSSPKIDLSPESLLAPIQNGGLAPSGGISPAGGPIAHAADGTPIYTDKQGNAIDPATGEATGTVGRTPTGIAAPMQVSGVASTPRSTISGGALNNPGNLENNSWTQSLPGYTGSKGRFATFATPEQGAAALDRNLQSYGAKGINTPLQITSTWAPKGDGKNDPVAYASVIAKNLGIGINDPIDLRDPAQRQKIGQSIAQVEGNTATSGTGIAPATAYDSTIGRGGGLASAPSAAAINQAAGPPAGLAGSTRQVSAPQFPDNSQTPSTGRTGLLGLNLSPETRQLMLSAGLGIMGGASRSALVNIGQGGLAGIASARQNMATSADVGLKSAQTQSFQMENQIKAQQLKLMMSALNGNADANTAAASSGPGSAPSPTAPTVTAPGVVANQPARTAATGAGAPLDPNFDPAVIARNINAEKWINPQAASADRERLNQIVQSGRARDVNGNIVNLPGFANAEAELAANKAGAEESAKSHYQLQEVQDTPGGPTRFVPKSQVLSQTNAGATPVGVGAGSPPGAGVDAAAAANPAIAKQPEFYAEKQKQIATGENEMVQQYQARQLSRQRLQALSGIMQTYQPGAFAQQKADIVGALRGVGIPVADSDTANPAAFQEFSKNAIANVFNDVKSQGGRILVSEIAGLTKANANPELQPAAAAAIIGQGLGVLNYEDQHAKDYFAWKDKNPNTTNTAAFELPWADQHPVAQYVDQATKGIAYSGQNVPPPQGRVAGQTYMTPKGPAVWKGNGWQLGAAP